MLHIQRVAAVRPRPSTARARSSIPEAVKLYSDLHVKHEPLTLVRARRRALRSKVKGSRVAKCTQFDGRRQSLRTLRIFAILYGFNHGDG